MADAIVGNTQLGATKQALISAVVQKEIAFKAMLAGVVKNVSEFAVPDALSIGFPKLTSFTATNRASGATGDATVLTSSVETLALSLKPYIAWLGDSNDVIQSTLAFEMEAAKRAASAAGRYLDSAIIAALEADAEPLVATGNITRDIVLDMREYLLENEGEDMSLIVSVDQEKELLKIAEFSRQDYYGGEVIKSGQIGSLYGIPVIRSNALGATTYYMVAKEGCAFGFQKEFSMSTQAANEYGVSATRTAMDALLGVKTLQIDEGTSSAGKSAWIIKDNN